MLLKQLAQEGRIIICTIHQPSAIIFEMFDSLYAMADGYCIYQGSIKGLVVYLSEAGLECPPYHNPADYCNLLIICYYCPIDYNFLVLEVASGEYGSQIENLTRKSENGLCQDWAKSPRDVIPSQSFEHIGI